MTDETLLIAEYPKVPPRSAKCPEDSADGEHHFLSKSIDIDVIDGKATLVITCLCSCGWRDELVINENTIDG